MMKLTWLRPGLIAIFLASAARAAPPPATKDPMAGMSPAEIAEGAEVARREVPAFVGEPNRKVLGVQPLVPYIYFVDLGGDKRFQVLVVDGHVVKGRSDAAVGKWLEKTHFLEKRDPAAGPRLVAVLNEWGEMPLGFESLALDSPPPIAGAPKPGLSFEAHRASLVLYGQWRKVPKMPKEGERPRLELGPIEQLRATLRIDSKYKLKWTIEQLHGTRWQPFRG